MHESSAGGYSSVNQILDQSTGEQQNKEKGGTSALTDDYTIEEDGEDTDQNATPAEDAQRVSSGIQSNKMGTSSSANEISQVQAKRQPTGDFIGTQLNDESDATSNPARGSSFMEKREIMASAESQ